VGKHETGYARIERDLYPTPAWVIAALAEHIDFRNLTVWEPACGDGRMAEALKLAGCSRVYATDIVNGYTGQDEILDFLSGLEPKLLPRSPDGTVTNPPFGNRRWIPGVAATERFRFREDPIALLWRLPPFHRQGHAHETGKVVRASGQAGP
jgi:hypothetical protein